MSEVIDIRLIKPAFLAKVKPYQNGLLGSWIAMVFLSAIFTTVNENVSEWLFICAAILFIPFLVLSATMLFRRKPAQARIANHELRMVVDDELVSFPINEVKFLLNVVNPDSDSSPADLDARPEWGSFIVVNHCGKIKLIPFIVCEALIQARKELKIKFEYKPTLFGNTAKLAHEFLSGLGAGIIYILNLGSNLEKTILSPKSLGNPQMAIGCFGSFPAARSTH